MEADERGGEKRGKEGGPRRLTDSWVETSILTTGPGYRLDQEHHR